ncbi:hypothetical protein JL721_11945 [Aureococcus anophagefferens]|nr:hypothetical protein JL721_11945 [Aureococcus anophagefferens]
MRFAPSDPVKMPKRHGDKFKRHKPPHAAPAQPKPPAKVALPGEGAPGPKERAYQLKVDAARAVGYRETLLMQLNAVVLHWPRKSTQAAASDMARARSRKPRGSCGTSRPSCATRACGAKMADDLDFVSDARGAEAWRAACFCPGNPLLLTRDEINGVGAPGRVGRLQAASVVILDVVRRHRASAAERHRAAGRPNSRAAEKLEHAGGARAIAFDAAETGGAADLTPVPRGRPAALTPPADAAAAAAPPPTPPKTPPKTPRPSPRPSPRPAAAARAVARARGGRGAAAAPPAPAVGDADADFNEEGEYYPGTVARVNADGTYYITYDDGDEEDKVREAMVEPAAAEPATSPGDAPPAVAVDDDSIVDEEEAVPETRSPASAAASPRAFADEPAAGEPSASASALDDAPEPAAALDEPVADEPAVEEEPVADEPAVEDEPVADEPAVEEEPVDEPAVEEEPVVDEPAVEEEPVAVSAEPAVLDEPVVVAADPPVLAEPAAARPQTPEAAADEPLDEPVAEEPSDDAAGGVEEECAVVEEAGDDYEDDAEEYSMDEDAFAEDSAEAAESPVRETIETNPHRGAASCYEFGALLGEGAYGEVYRGRHRASGASVAVKKLKIVADGADEDAEMARYAVLTAERELALLRAMGDHANVVRFTDSWQEDLVAGSIAVVAPVLCFELLAMTALHALEDRGPGAFGRGLCLALTRDLCAALAHIHALRIVHRDIKPENVLLSGAPGGQRCELKLCDFGAARQLEGDLGPDGVGLAPQAAAGELTHYIGSRWYRAPEMMASSTTYGLRVDVWGAACITAELATGEPLFPGDEEHGVLRQIASLLGPLPPAPAKHLARLGVPKRCLDAGPAVGLRAAQRGALLAQLGDAGLDLLGPCCGPTPRRGSRRRRASTTRRSGAAAGGDAAAAAGDGAATLRRRLTLEPSPRAFHRGGARRGPGLWRWWWRRTAAATGHASATSRSPTRSSSARRPPPADDGAADDGGDGAAGDLGAGSDVGSAGAAPSGEDAAQRSEASLLDALRGAVEERFHARSVNEALAVVTPMLVDSEVASAAKTRGVSRLEGLLGLPPLRDHAALLRPASKAALLYVALARRPARRLNLVTARGSVWGDCEHLIARHTACLDAAAAKAVVERLDGGDGDDLGDLDLDDCDYDEDVEGSGEEVEARGERPVGEDGEPGSALAIEVARHASFIVCPYYRAPFGQKYVEGVAVEEGEGLGPRKELFSLLGATARRDWTPAGGFEHGLRVAPRRAGDGPNVLRLVVDDDASRGAAESGAAGQPWVARALRDGTGDSGASSGSAPALAAPPLQPGHVLAVDYHDGDGAARTLDLVVERLLDGDGAEIVARVSTSSTALRAAAAAAGGSGDDALGAFFASLERCHVEPRARCQAMLVHRGDLEALWLNPALPRTAANARKLAMLGLLVGSAVPNQRRATSSCSTAATLETVAASLKLDDASLDAMAALEGWSTADLVGAAGGAPGEAGHRARVGYARLSAAGRCRALEWQFRALRRGFERAMPRRVRRSVRPSARDLQRIVCGAPEFRGDFKFRDVFRIVMDAELRDCRPLHDALWAVIDGEDDSLGDGDILDEAEPMPGARHCEPLDAAQRRKLLKFVTGVERLPARHTEFLTIELPFLPFGVDEQRRMLAMIPQSHTCDNILELPNYWEALLKTRVVDGGAAPPLGSPESNALERELRHVVRTKLLVAIDNATGYGLDALEPHVSHALACAAEDDAAAAALLAHGVLLDARDAAHGADGDYACDYLFDDDDDGDIPAIPSLGDGDGGGLDESIPALDDAIPALDDDIPALDDDIPALDDEAPPDIPALDDDDDAIPALNDARAAPDDDLEPLESSPRPDADAVRAPATPTQDDSLDISGLDLGEPSPKLPSPSPTTRRSRGSPRKSEAESEGYGDGTSRTSRTTSSCPEL